MADDASGFDRMDLELAIDALLKDEDDDETDAAIEQYRTILSGLAARGHDMASCANAMASVRPSKELEPHSYTGFREMRGLQDNCDFDALDALPDGTISSIHSLYQYVLGKAMRQEEVVGVVTAGPMAVVGPHAQPRSKQHQGVRFGGHDEVWQVRSSPKGRIGMPLEPGEVRKVTVLIRSTDKAVTLGSVATIKLWLMPPATATERPEVQRGVATYGALGVGVHALHLFERFHDQAADKTGFHAVYSSYALLTKQMTDGQHAGKRIPRMMQRGYVHPLVIAARIGSFDWPDYSARYRGLATFDEKEWTREKNAANVQFCDYVTKRFPESDSATMAGRLIFSAEDIFEQISLVGWLDTLSDPFFANTLPDDVSRPNGIPLLMAAAIRIACDPNRWGLSNSTPDDLWAARELASMLEAVQSNVLMIDPNASRAGTYLFATDLFVEDTIIALRGDLEIHEHENSVPKNTIEQVRLTMQNATEVLYNAGVALAIEVCGVPPKTRDGTTGIYNDYGLAEKRFDPVAEARAQLAYDNGLGNLAPWTVTTRTSLHGMRQQTLMRLFTEVERWLLDGTFHDVHLPLRNKEPEPEQDEVSVHREIDETGQVASISVEATSANELKSNKKKKQRAAAKRDKKTTGASPSASHTMNIKQLSAHALTDEQAFQKVAETISKRTKERQQRQREKMRKETLLSSSVIDGGTLLGDIFQNGVCKATSDSFQLSSFAVSHTSVVQCSYCPRQVNVLESIAFAGKWSRCRACHRPRCLVCVSEDIDNLNRNTTLPDDKKLFIVGRDVVGCAFCARA